MTYVLYLFLLKCSITSGSIITSACNNEHTGHVLDTVTDMSPLLMLYEMEMFYSFLEDYMTSVLHNAVSLDSYRNLNFLLICGDKSLAGLMNYVTDQDLSNGQGSLLRHFSTWLIISPDRPSGLNITLDHVSLIKISYSGNETYLSFPDLKNAKKRVLDLSEIDLYTLLWMPTGREWSRVHICDKQPNEQHNIVFPNKPKGLNGRQLRLTALEWPLYAVRHLTDGKVEYTGIGIDGVNILGRKFNFSYVVVEPVDKAWGQELKNGSWTGVAGMIQKAEADMSPVPHAMSQRRKQIMDFSFPFVSTEYLAVYRKRADNSNSWLYFLHFFSWEVYLSGAAALVWIIMMFICIQYTSYRTKNLSCYVEFAFHVPLRQGMVKLPEESSARVVVFTWCMFCLVMTGVYTGNLVAFATVDKYRPPFTTLRELAEQDEYAVGVLEGTYAEQMLMYSSDPVLKSIFEKISESRRTTNTVNTYHDAVERIMDEKYVQITVKAVIDIVRSMTCDVVQLKERLNPIHSGYIYPKHSPLKKLFDDQITLLADLGIFAKLIEKQAPKAKICDLPEKGSQFTLNNLKTVFIACAVGIFISVLVLVFELRNT